MNLWLGKEKTKTSLLGGGVRVGVAYKNEELGKGGGRGRGLQQIC